MSEAVLERSPYFDDPEREVWHIRVAKLLRAGLALPAGAVALGSSVFTDTANPYLIQERIGPDGKPYEFVKIRTIDEARVNGHPVQTQGAVDSRASFGANLVRASGLDEYEQLKAAAEGELALIGTRSLLKVDLKELRHICKMAVNEGWTEDQNFFERWYEEGPYSLPHGVFGPSQLYRRLFSKESALVLFESMEAENYWYQKASFKMEMAILGLSPAVLGLATAKAAVTQVRRRLPPILPRD